jgi:GAF domain-containing protein
MIIIGCDYHPGFQQIAFVDTETLKMFCKMIVLRRTHFFVTKGIHFYADVPLLTRSGKLVGSLRVLDTRPRHITDQERECLEAAALAAGEAVELRTVASPAEPPAEALPRQ